jgi:hypothetical protein
MLKLYSFATVYFQRLMSCNRCVSLSEVYIWSKNVSHSDYEKSEAKMMELTSNSYEGRKQFLYLFPPDKSILFLMFLFLINPFYF